MLTVYGSGGGFRPAGISGDTRRWFSVGWSDDPNSSIAARYAAREALQGPYPRLLITLCSEGHDPDKVIAALTDIAPDVPRVGSSTSSIMTPAGPSTTGIAIVAMGGQGFTIATAAARVSGGRQREAGAQVASCFTRVDQSEYRVLLVLTDGLSADQEAILSGIYGIVGASLPLIGGSSRASTPGARIFQFHNHEVLTDAVIAVAIGSDAPMGVGLRHGWRRAGQPLVVTHSANGIVKELNDEPALRTYLRRLQAPLAAYTDLCSFQSFARKHPIGVSRRGGEDVRDVSSCEFFQKGWLRSSGEIPEGGLVWLMEGDVESVLAAAGDAATAAINALGNMPALGIIAFNCVFRHGLLGEVGTRREVSCLADIGLPFVGMYTSGEIARFRGINAYHNLTLAVLALG